MSVSSQADRILPQRPNLDKLKRMARALQRASAEPSALARLRVVFPDLAPGSAKLSQAQTVIAREHGQPSWTKLAEAVALRKPAKVRPLPIVYPSAPDLAARWRKFVAAGDISALLLSMHTPRKLRLAARALLLAQPDDYRRLVDMLVAGLSHRHGTVRAGCALTLDTFGDERCREPLAVLIDDPIPRVRWAAMHALTCHDCGEETCWDDPARIAAAARTDPNLKVRRHAAISLGFTRTPFAAAVLKELIAAEPEPKFQSMARWALRFCETGRR